MQTGPSRLWRPRPRRLYKQLREQLSCLSKLTINESSNRAIQFKKIINADKRYLYIGDIFCKNTELLEAAFLPPYPDASRWSIKFHTKIKTIDPASAPGTNGSRTPIKEMVEKTHVINTNHQMQLLAECEQKFK